MREKIFGVIAVVLAIAAKLATNVDAMGLAVALISLAIVAGFASGYIQRFIYEIKEAMYE